MYFPVKLINLEHTEILLESVIIFILSLNFILCAFCVITLLLSRFPKGKLRFPVKYSAMDGVDLVDHTTVFTRNGSSQDLRMTK